VKELKGTGIIDTFTYTPAGYLFAWLLKRSNPEQRQNANNEIYDLLANAFKAREDSSSLTISMFLQKCKDKQVFGKLVEYIDSLIHSDLDPKIKSITDLLVYIFDSGFRDTQEQTIFMNLWYETIRELRPKIRKMMLYRMKSSLEKRFERKLEYVSKEYEAFQFKLRTNYQQIALEGYCRNCKLKRNVALHYLDYIKTVSAASRDIMVRCTICNMKDSIIIPNLF
jgi:hypothetical protein